MRPLPLGFAALLVWTSACAGSPQDEGDGPAPDAEQATFVVGKADGGCLDPDSAVARGVLDLVNDPSVSFEDLDDPVSEGGAGLYRTAALGLVEQRPFETLAELDAVPYVGPHACRSLARHACNVEGRCVQSISVVTWNLRHFPLTPATEDAVVQTLTELNPDFVGVQEVQDASTLERIAQRVPGFRAIVAEPGPYSGVAALVQESSLKIRGTQDLFEDDWFAFPRPMLTVEVDVAGAPNTAPLHLGIVHLKAMSDDTSKDRRREASATLRRWFDERRTTGPGHTVLLGDLNDEVTDPPWQNVFAALLDDDADLTVLTEPVEASGASSYIPWSRMLDHVIVTDSLEPFHVDTDVLALDQGPEYERDVSDHRPVLCLFEFPVAYEG